MLFPIRNIKEIGMSGLAVLDTILKELKEKSKGKELMLLGVALIVLSNYIQPSDVIPLSPVYVLLFLGMFTFSFGLAICSKERKKQTRRIKYKSRREPKKR